MIFKDKWFILFILLVATILSPLDFYIVNLALPSIQHSLRSSSSELQMIVSFILVLMLCFRYQEGDLEISMEGERYL